MVGCLPLSRAMGNGSARVTSQSGKKKGLTETRLVAPHQDDNLSQRHPLCKMSHTGAKLAAAGGSA